MPTIVIYSSAFCPYCIRARRLLKKKGVTYTEMSVEDSPEVWDDMVVKTKRHTVPQIFIDDYHVGGFDDLQALDKEDRLDALLGLG